jgi:PAS domain S-box-containing protein
MNTRLSRLLAPPVFTENPESTLFARHIYIITLALFGLWLFPLLAEIARGHLFRTTIWVIEELVLLLVFWLCSEHKLSPAIYLLLADMVIGAVDRYQVEHEGFRDVALMFFPVILGVAALFLRHWGFTVFSSLLLLLVVTLIRIERPHAAHTVVPFLCVTAAMIGVLNFTLRASLQKQRETQEKLQLMSGASFEGLYFTEKTRIMEVNDQFVALTGYSSREIFCKSILSIVPPELAPMVAKHYSEVPEAIYEHPIIKKDGTLILVEVRSRMLKHRGTHIRASAMRDITRERNAVEQMRLQVAALRAAANSVMITDCEGVIRWINPAFTKLTGYSETEALGQNPRMLKSDLQNPTYYADLWKTVTSGGTWQGVVVNKRKDGSLYDEEMTITPVADGAGKVTHFVAIKQDVTQRNKTQAALYDSEQRFRGIFDQAGTGIVLGALDGRCIMANRAACEFIGRSEAELVQLKLEDIVYQEDLHLTKGLGSKLASGELAVYRIERRYVRADGAIVWGSASVSSVRDPSGKPEYLIGVIVDITDRKKAEEAQRESDKRLRVALEAAQMGVWEWEVQTDKLTWSPECFDLYGPVPFTGKGENFTSLVHPEDRAIIQASMEKVLHGNENIEVEFRMILPGKGVRWMSNLGKLHRDSQGVPARIVGTVQDITERKQADEKLRLAELEFRNLFEQAPYGIVVHHPVTLLPLEFNTAACRLLGYAPEEFAKLPVSAYNVHRTADEIRANCSRALQKDITQFEVKLRTKAGILRDVAITLMPIRLEQGTMLHSIWQDITVQKQSELAVREAELKFRNLFQKSPFAVLTIDPETALPIEFNDAACLQLGYSREEFAKLRVADYEVGSTSEAFQSKVAAVMRRQLPPFETKHTTKSGEIRDVLITAQPLVINGRVQVHVMVLDTTEQKRAEQALHKSESLYRNLFETSSESIFVITKDGIVDCNPSALKLLDCSREQVIGQQPQSFWPEFQPDKQASILKGAEKINEVLAGNAQELEWVCKRRDGTPFYAEVFAARMPSVDASCWMALMRDVSERREFVRSLQESESHLRLLFLSLDSLREDERKRLSHELHDQAGQHLTALKLELGSAEANSLRLPDSETKERVRARLVKARELVAQTHLILTDVAASLRPTLSTGLLIALKSELHLQAVRYSWTASEDLPGEELPLTDSASGLLFRIFQEGLTNIARHAKASHVKLRLSLSHNLLTMELQDNGIGLAPKPKEGHHLGLLGIEDRAARLGGSSSIMAADGGGTVLSVGIPYRENCKPVVTQVPLFRP